MLDEQHMFSFLRKFVRHRKSNNRRSQRTPKVEVLEPRSVFAAGELDTGFGDEGIAILDFNGRLDFANAVAVQTDGMTLVAGHSGRIEGFQPRTDLTVVRLTDDGSLDPDFGDEGIARVFFDDAHGNAHGMAVQENDRVVVVGEMQPARGFVVLRLDSTGALDPEFNGTGLFTTELSSRANDVVIQSDRKILVVGDAQGPLGFQIFLARFNEDGSLDPDFDEDGVLFTPVLVADVCKGSRVAARRENSRRRICLVRRNRALVDFRRALRGQWRQSRRELRRRRTDQHHRLDG
jgi:uncharacterized delta-60 repeat protein